MDAAVKKLYSKSDIKKPCIIFLLIVVNRINKNYFIYISGYSTEVDRTPAPS